MFHEGANTLLRIFNSFPIRNAECIKYVRVKEQMRNPTGTILVITIVMIRVADSMRQEQITISRAFSCSL